MHPLTPALVVSRAGVFVVYAIGETQMKAIAKESPERRGRSYMSAYLPIATKQRLVAAAELNGLTLTGLIVAVGENAHRILPLLRLDGAEQSETVNTL